MQTISMLLAIATTISTAAAAPAAAAPDAVVKVYDLADCVEASGFDGIITSRDYNLPKSKCISITPIFTSFQAVVSTACPEGKEATVKAFPDMNCKDDGFSAGEVTSELGQCTETVIKLQDGSVSVGAQSAKFTC